MGDGRLSAWSGATTSAIVAAAVLALAACGDRDAHANARPTRAHVASPVATSARSQLSPAPPAPDAPRRLHAWTAHVAMAHAFPPQYARPQVIVHIPEGFDPDAPLHLVVYLHGSNICALAFAERGPVQCVPSRPEVPGLRGIDRHDAAATNTIFVVPQLWFAGVDAFAPPGAFRAFIDELLGTVLAASPLGARSYDDVADITLLAHSAGNYVLDAILSNGGADDRVRNVVLFDGVMTGTDAYLAWLDGDPRRRFVSIVGGVASARTQSRRLLARFTAQHPGTATDAHVDLTGAIRTHRLVIGHSPHPHVWIPVLYLTKTLEGLGLPPREVADAYAPERALAPHTWPAGSRFDGRFERSDAQLASGAYVEDFVVPHASRTLEIVARGDRVDGAPSELDMVLVLVRDGRAIASDDDGGGGFAARLDVPPGNRTEEFVRVTTFGPDARTGPFHLTWRPIP